MTHRLARALIGVLSLAFACGAIAADKKSDAKKLSGNDREFITKAAEDGLAEVELGKIAQQNAASAEVKKFGERMVNDHSKANQELEALATKLGVTPPKQLSAYHASEVKRLSKLTGAKFDQAYSDHMVKDHEKASAVFEKQAKRGDAEELKQFAAQTLPVLQEHLKMAKSLTTQKK